MQLTDSTKQAMLNGLRQDLAAAQDNLHRARAAFYGHTSDFMSDRYGQSEQTPNQIIAGYTEWANKAQQALNEAEHFLNPAPQQE